MLQSSKVGVFFAVGLVCGLVISFMVTNFTSIKGQSIALSSRLSPTISDILAKTNSASEIDSREYTESTVTDRPINNDEDESDIEHKNNKVYEESHAEKEFNKQPLSHDELDKIPGRKDVIDLEKEDKHFHHDDKSVAENLYNTVRVLCWVMTSPETLESKARHVNITWAKRCNKVIYISEQDNADFPTVGIKVEHGRDHLTAKTMGAFDYIYKNHFNDADWFLKADDDTYVVVENLRYFLSSHSPEEPIFFGHHFGVIVSQGYFSGGGGYAVSKEALRRYGLRAEGTCAKDQGAEDVEWGRCMERLGVKTGDSRDALGRSRFHCFNPETHIHGGYPDWYYKYDKYGAKKGIDSISDYPITFHYVPVEQMYNLEYYVYHIRAYGIQQNDQDVNRKDGEILTTMTSTPNLKPTPTINIPKTTAPVEQPLEIKTSIPADMRTRQVVQGTSAVVRSLENRLQNQLVQGEQSLPRNPTTQGPSLVAHVVQQKSDIDNLQKPSDSDLLLNKIQRNVV